MPHSPILTEADIRALTSGQSFERGAKYYRSGAVHKLVRRGDHVTAKVEGSAYQPYHIEVTLDASGVAVATCTCPYDWGGYCKHIAAVLLHLVNEPEQVEERAELSQLLADLTADQLRQVILGLADERLELVEAVEREVDWLRATPGDGMTSNAPASVDINAVRRAIGREFRQAGSPSDRGYGDDYYDDDGPYIEPDTILEPHLETVQRLLDAGETETAAATLSAIFDAWIDGLTDLEEWVYDYNEPSLEDASLRLDVALAELLLSLPDTDRPMWLARIDDWEEGLGELEAARTALEHGWQYPPLVAAMEGEITEKGAWAGDAPDFADALALARLRILDRQGRTEEYVNLATAEGQFDLAVVKMAQSGQTERAVAEAKEYLLDPNAFLALATTLAEQDQIEAALEAAEHGLAVEHDYFKNQKRALATWVQEQAQEAGRPDLALAAAEASFSASPTLAGYTAVQRLAGERWPEVKPRLLETLAATWDISARIDVYLHEGMLVEAMEAVEGSYADHDLMRVIKAVRETEPDWCIARCRAKARAIMDAGQSNAYHTAVSWLRTAGEIYRQHGRQAEWQKLLDGLLETHQRKYKLVPMLRELR